MMVRPQVYEFPGGKRMWQIVTGIFFKNLRILTEFGIYRLF